MASRTQSNLPVSAFHPGRGFGVRATWSRAISTRADVKLAPCMARPNLFSGD
ncbi:MAG: hypothetical protein WA655_15505 [Candidatus Korobacteraceae bacterium]